MKKRLITSISSVLISTAILNTSITYADDSEVFFGSEQFMTKSKPNILFLLDISGSMSASMILEDGSSTTRIDALKDAVREVLYSRSLVNVNVGVMSFGPPVYDSNTAPGQGAQLIHPVVDIDQITDEETETISRADTSKDDAHQTTLTNAAVIDSNVMVMGNLGTGSNTVEVDLGASSRLDNIFLLPRSDQYTNDDAAFSNALHWTCSIVLDKNTQDSEHCKKDFLSKQGTGIYGWTHIIENVNINGQQRDVITGINGSAYNLNYGQKALFIFRNINIPSDAKITQATLTITPKTDGFHKDTKNSFCTGTGTQGESEWLNWRISTQRNFPTPIHDNLIYIKTKNTISDFNFWPREGSAYYGIRYYNVRQNETRWNSNAGNTAETNWGKPQNGATCWWQKDYPISMNITTALQEALNLGTTDTTSNAYPLINDFKTPSALSGAPMADVAIKFWTGGAYFYSKPYIAYGQGAPKLKVSYTSNIARTSMGALRFNNITIPQGARVTKAIVKMVPAGGSGDLTLRIRGELPTMGDAKEFNEGENLTKRKQTSQAVSWSTTPDQWQTQNDHTNKYITTPDIKSILQEIVNKPEWCGSQSIVLFFEKATGNGVRSAFTTDEGKGYRPVIEYEYDTSSVPTNTCLLKNWEETLGSRSDDGSQDCPTCLTNIRGTAGLNFWNNNYTIGLRYPNTLLKSPKDAGTEGLTNKGLSSAILKLNVRYTDYLGDYDGSNNKLTIVLDKAVDSPRIKPMVKDLTNRWDTTYSTTCILPNTRVKVGSWIECDVSDLIRQKIQQKGWKDGNALTFLIKKPSGQSLFIKSYEDGYTTSARVEVSAKDALMAPNSRTIRKRIVQEVDALDTTGITPMVPALYDAARYISNIQGSGPKGPYHAVQQWKGSEPGSPLLSNCQATHLIIMSDGEANNQPTAFRKAIVSYTGASYQNNPLLCAFDNGVDYGDDRSCGRALVKWMNTTSQSYFADDPRENLVTTHTVGLTTSTTSGAAKFLADLAQAGGGLSRTANDTDGLVDAFMSIIDSAKEVNSTYVSGQVSLSPQSKYDQRTEIYYSLLRPSARNYWQGNLKRYQLVYVDFDGKQRAALRDINNKTAVMKDSDEVYFINKNATSWWTTSQDAPDGGIVNKGGVLEMLADNPSKRNIKFTSEAPQLNYNNYNFDKFNVGAGQENITSKDLGIAEDKDIETRQMSQGLVSFIQGYLYSATGDIPKSSTVFDTNEVAPKKIGDAARSSVTFANYGCETNIDGQIRPLLECPAENLQQTLFLAGNDGFFRGFDMKSGKQNFAVIPQSLLLNLKELQEATVISPTVERLYGLDGTVKIFHNDTNNNGYIDNNEDAYAIVVTGRGGRNIYAYDISQSHKSLPKLTWMITPETTGFSNLGYTWSVPAYGKVKINDTVTNVLIFGGGYDPKQDRIPTRASDDMGAAIYMVALEGNYRGKLIDVISNSANKGVTKMNYSIPGTPSYITTDDKSYENKLITDIFVGDMGGQLWRIKVNNGNNVGNLLSVQNIGEGGVVASIAGDGEENSRRIYESPAVFPFTDETNRDKISVNIATGYRGHPLSQKTNDKFYSFRLPKDPAQSAKVALRQNNLALAVPSKNGEMQGDDLKFFEQNGFYINLKQKGEKVVSALLADFNLVAFNSYIPNDGSLKTCKPGNGQQRSYLYSLTTGKSLFEDAYLATTVSGLPSEPTLYCNASYCTISYGFDSLAEDGNSYINTETVIEREKKGGYVKTGWTDLFVL